MYRKASCFTQSLSCFFLLLILFFTSCVTSIAQSKYNLDFETLDSVSLPTGWRIPKSVYDEGYIVKLDSTIKQNGKYAISIVKNTPLATGSFAAVSYPIPAFASGKQIKLTGYVKTEEVKNGFVGLWLRVDGSGGSIAFDNMSARGIKGTTDWQQYTITLPYDVVKAENIVIGAIFTGEGKVWVDNLQLTIDGEPVENIAYKTTTKADKDTAFMKNGSGLADLNISGERLAVFTNLGMIWGFLKYYHPAIAKGDYNWDAELFRILYKLDKTTSNAEAYTLMEQWIDALGPVNLNVRAKTIDKIKYAPDYGNLFKEGNLPSSLVQKLTALKEHYVMPSNHYYIEFTKGVGNPQFKKENGFNYLSFPDAGTRLLALYRYWNMIQYFFPYRHLIGEDWNKVLPEFIPRFVKAKDNNEYTIACLELIARIHDTHANIWGYGKTLDSLKGMLAVPVEAKFVENKLVVTGYYSDSLDIKNKLHIGDVIEKIDNVSVDDLVKKYLPLTPASNYETQLRDMPSLFGFLLRSNRAQASLAVKNKDGRTSEVFVQRLPAYDLYKGRAKLKESITGYKLLSEDIGYIYPEKLKEKDLETIKDLFKKTKGIVIDLRCYPSTFMPFSYGAWLKANATPFTAFTMPTLSLPGAILNGESVTNGGGAGRKYDGKVVIIVNAESQSNAEYTTMALSSTPGAIVIGSTTAGADGNVSEIFLPGGIRTMISGIGVYYPDGTETQRKGVKIDIPLKPSINGIREGKDELLDKAIQLIRQ